ncbi:MAG: hypothetical protein L7H05_00135 [Vulcanisaeta sp.]|nr:hypothetical protein [Vulcanisaeta sp.]
MARGLPAYVLGGLIILMGMVISISLILSIPSPITTITGYLNITANAYLGLGNYLLVIVGQNNFNLPITRLGIYIPRTGTNITVTTEIPSGSYFLLMIFQGLNTSSIIAPGLEVYGDPGNLSRINRPGYAYGLNATAVVNDEVTRHYVFQAVALDSPIVVAVPYIANLSRPVVTMYVFQMVPLGAVDIDGFGLASTTQQLTQWVACNLSKPIALTPRGFTYMVINMSAANGTAWPLGIGYVCNATPSTALPMPLYLLVTVRYTYVYGMITVVREDSFPVLVIPMKLSNA